MVGIINFISLCLTRLYVVIICDDYIILDGIFGTKNRIGLLFVSNRREKGFVNSIYDDVWEAKYEITGALID